MFQVNAIAKCVESIFFAKKNEIFFEENGGFALRMYGKAQFHEACYVLRLYSTLFFCTIKKNAHVIFRAFLIDL